MKKCRMLMATCALLLMLTACGSFNKDYDTTTVYIGKDQEVSEYIVEDFDKSYYDTEELKQNMEQTIQEYNQKNGASDLVVLDQYELSDDSAKLNVRIRYKSAKDYGNIHNCEFFVGTVKEAREAGYVLEGLHAAEAQSAKTLAPVDQMTEEMVVICEEEMDVEVKGDILYISDNVALKSSGLATVGESDTYSVMVYQ